MVARAVVRMPTVLCLWISEIIASLPGRCALTVLELLTLKPKGSRRSRACLPKKDHRRSGIPPCPENKRFQNPAAMAEPGDHAAAAPGGQASFRLRPYVGIGLTTRLMNLRCIIEYGSSRVLG
jgi:hypothetical protein